MIHNTEYQPKLTHIEVNDPFWTYFQNLILNQVIPYQEQILRDEIPNIEKSHCIENFKIAAGLSQGDFYGMVFQDSDLAKWMEAVSNAMALSDNSWFHNKADEMIELIEKAQESDGYLDTYFQIKMPDKKWNNLQECHELYCMGHMIEATVAHFESTGETKFLKIGRKIADCIDARFGKDKHRGIPGHPEIEIALLRLYHVTGEEKYRNLAQYFIDERGTEPNFFEEEAKHKDINIWKMDYGDTEYAQNNKPVRELDEAVGHAVRAIYLYTAMADLAADIGDQELYDACERLWDNIVNKKMHITGGVGSDARREAFSINYDLPNDTVYAETCASVAMVFFAREMLQIRPDRKYSDIMEKEFYNGLLSGMQHDGKRFFYVNPLEVDPAVSGKLYGYEHVLPVRPQWYACACCPPNVSRSITAYGKYAWGENEDTIYSHLYLGGTFTSEKIPGVAIHVESNYPWEGRIKYTVSANTNQHKFTLGIRIPEWARTPVVLYNGTRLSIDACMKDGYVYIAGIEKVEDVIEVQFEMPVRRIYANANVRKDRGLVAIARGPIVYALEEKDNGPKLYDVVLPDDAAFETRVKDDAAIGKYIEVSADGLRYTSSTDEALYSCTKPACVAQRLEFIPYYLWGNRGEGEMRVWVEE